MKSAQACVSFDALSSRGPYGAAWSCCIAVMMVAAVVAAVDAAETKARVCLDRSENMAVPVNGKVSQSLWSREVIRQALLIAARSEMNLPTADFVLGEVTDTDDKELLELHCRGGGVSVISLTQGARNNRNMVWSHTFKNMSGWPYHRSWVERLEELSRGGFVEALKERGYERRERPRSNDHALPLDPQLVKLIDEELSFESQFVALRKLHAAMASDGETRARLGGLVRAYSHLGLLTEHQWHPISHVFKARALLYAQRWAVLDPKSALAMQHRAYAFALVGMHGEALKDLEAATALATKAADPPQPPAWIGLLEAYCRCDYKQLLQLQAAEKPLPVASLLCFLAHEQEGSRNLTVKVGMIVMEDIGGCDRILDTLCHLTGPGAGHFTTQAGQIHLATTLLPRLAQFDELPAAVRAALDDAQKAGAMLDENSDGSDLLAEIEHRAKVLAALRAPPEEPDLAEPGWPALASMIEETSFMQVYRRAFFVRKKIGVPVDEELEAYAPVVESHRLAPFLDLFRTTIDEDKITKAMTELNRFDNSFAQASLWATWSGDPLQRAFSSAVVHRECLPNETGLISRLYGTNVPDLSAGPLLAVSPHSPYAMALAASQAPPKAGSDEKSWEEAAQRSPRLASELAVVWKGRGDLAKAEQFLKLAATLDPSHTTHRQLAEHYLAQGDDENWLKAMNDLLETPSLGLEHARARCEIAEYYVNRREWEKALPYADAAAQTGAQWALNWGRAVNEANQNWEAAELAHVLLIERYGESPVYWYFFCQRNGCGQLDAAREAAFPNGVSALVLKSELTTNFVALALSMEGESIKALEILEREAKDKKTSWVTMRAALMADSVGNAAKRDALLKQVLEQPEQQPNDYDHRPHRAELIDLARAIVADLAAGGKGDLKLEELEVSRDRAPPNDHCSFNYFLGCYLDQRGKPEAAVKYWKQCMAAQDLVMSTRTAAGYELHRHGVKPSEWKELFLARPKEMK